MAIIIRVPGIAYNKNLPTLAGSDPDAAFGEIWLDFGSTTEDDAAWNKLSLAGTNTSELYALSSQPASNTMGSPTSVTVSAPQLWRLTSGGTEGSSTYPSNVSRDGFYIGASLGPEVEIAQIYIDGLSKKRLYDLEIFSSRESIDGKSRLGHFTAMGRTGLLEALNNTDNTLCLQDVAADENGRITLELELGTSLYAYINSLKIIEK